MILTVIIPIYNEAATCKDLIKKVKAISIQKQIIVVDDCSTDGSDEILKSIDGITIITHQANQGKGAAVRSATPYIQGEFVVLQDGDLEYNPADYAKMLILLEENKADIVFGSRWLDKTSSNNYHTIGNRLITWFANLVTQASITDMASCYKMIPTNIFNTLKLSSNGFGLEAEITAKVFKRNFTIIEVPIYYKRRTKKEGKKLRITDGIIAFWALLRYTLFR